MRTELSPDTPRLSLFDRLQVAKLHNRKLQEYIGILTSERDEAIDLLRQANAVLQQLMQANNQDRKFLKKDWQLRRLHTELAVSQGINKELTKQNRELRKRLMKEGRAAA